MGKRTDQVVDQAVEEVVEPTDPEFIEVGTDTLERILTRVGEQSAESMRRSLNRPNPNYNHKSVYSHPEGDRARPKPQLTRTVFFCGMRQFEDQLTPEEIDLYNRFTSDKEARGGAWTAKVIRRPGSREVLMINVPTKGLDQVMDLPSGITLILRELLDGKDAADPGSLARRVEELENRLKVLGATA